LVRVLLLLADWCVYSIYNGARTVILHRPFPDHETNQLVEG